MKFDAWVLPFISLIALSASPAEAQAALRGLQRNSNNGGGRGGRVPPALGGGIEVGRGVDALLGGAKGALSTSGRTRMIVTVNADDRESARSQCARLAGISGGTVGRVFDRAIQGCTIELSNAAVASMGRNNIVQSMEPDQKVRALAEIPNPTWGLDRTDQCDPIGTEPLNQDYTQMDATGVKVYIVDTGVNAIQEKLDPYIGQDCHADTSGEEGNPLVDNNGHGTHVAGTACGDTYGVATNCKICAVQVLTAGGSGSNSGVIAGIEHVISDCTNENALCVANMSLGGGFSQALNDAVKQAVGMGIVFVVAAGNENSNACTTSPASEETAITVGSMMKVNGQTQDKVSGFSNWGNCVDIDAPGSSITSAWIPDVTSTITISGTSMASPHVAGLAAGILAQNPGMSPADVLAEIQNTAKRTGFNDKTDGSGDRPVMVANYQGGCNSPTPPPSPAPPCTPQQVKIQVNVQTDQYPSETSWTVKDNSGNQVFASGPYSASFTLHEDTSECLAMSLFEFKIEDTWGDGICCSYGSGSYEVFLDGELEGSGGAFSDSETVTFGDDSPPAPTGPTNPPVPDPTNAPVPAPTNPPTPNPTDQPTPNPTANPVTEAPTFKTCNMFTIDECTADKGCQWTGDCKNCGCQLCINGDPDLCPASA